MGTPVCGRVLRGAWSSRATSTLLGFVVGVSACSAKDRTSQSGSGGTAGASGVSGTAGTGTGAMGGGSGTGAGGGATGGASATGGNAGAGATGGTGGVAQSCAGGGDGMSNCGLTANEDCCASAPVSGGTFYRSYDGVSSGYTSQAYPATVSDFRLDKYETTVGRFRQFVNGAQGTQANPPLAGAGAHPILGVASGWQSVFNANLAASTTGLKASLKCDGTYQTWTDAPGGNEQLPMNCINWYEAFAFCIWDGGRLPTEAEWNYAAAGGSEQRVYPWSSPANSTTIDCTYANFDPGTLCSVTGANDVGSESIKGNGKYGQADLAGNIFEWTLDWHSIYANPCDNCAQLTPASSHVVRGGAFNGNASDLLTSLRNFAAPEFRYFHLGVRCVRPMP